MSALFDTAKGLVEAHAAAISPEYRERLDLVRRYHEVCSAITAHSNEAAIWKVREMNARKRLARIVEEFETKGWMLP